MNSRDRTIALVGGLSMSLLVLAALLYALLDGRDVAQFLPPILGFAAPTIGALFAAAGIARVGDRVEAISKQVNGNTDRLLSQNDSLTRQLSAQVPNTLTDLPSSADGWADQ